MSIQIQGAAAEPVHAQAAAVVRASAWLVLWLLALPLSPTTTGAQTVPIPFELVADADGRWFEIFSDAFAQVDGGPSYPGGAGLNDAFYATSDYFDPTAGFVVRPTPVFTAIGSGANVFPLGANFGEVGDALVDVSGLTGIGIESAPIVDLDGVDFAAFIADNDAIVGTPYTTTITAVSGIATYEDGKPIALDFDASLTFTYDFAPFNGPLYDFEGVFASELDRFSLFVDPPGFASPFGTINYRWDVDGGIAVPEPAGLTSIACGTIWLGAMAYATSRRRSAPSDLA